MMESWQINKLDTAMAEIVRCLDIRNVLLKLQMNSVFDGDDCELVLNDSINRTDSEKRYKIVQLLKSRGQRAYYLFCHAIKERSQRLFEMLHGPDEENTSVCNVCKGETEKEFKHCNYCRGLTSVLSVFNDGIFIEKPEDIVDIFRHKCDQLAASKVELTEKTAEITKLRNANRQNVEHTNQMISQMSLVTDRLSAKEQNCKDLMLLKESITIEKETLAIKYQELQRQHQTLQDEHQKLTNHCDGLNHEGIYANCEAILRNHLRELEAKNRTLQEETLNMSKSLTKVKLENTQLQIQKDSAESLLKQQTAEHDAVFTNYQNQLEHLRRVEGRANYSIAELQDKILTLNVQNEQLEHENKSFANRLKDRDHAFITAQNRSKVSEREREDLKRLYDMQYQRVEELMENKEDLVKQYKNAIKERNAAKESISGLSEEKDRLIFRIFEEQKKYQELNKLFENSQIRIGHLQRQNSVNMTPPALNEGEFEVELQKANNGRYGVSFTSLKGRSRIIVQNIDYDNSNHAALRRISEGDYVIKINDVNVEEAHVSSLNEILAENNTTLKLTLRKRKQMKYHTSKLVVNTTQQGWDKMGIKFAFVAMVKGEGGTSCGLENMDEIIQVQKFRPAEKIEEITGNIRRAFKRQNPVEFIVVRMSEGAHQLSRSVSIESSQRSSSSDGSFCIKPPTSSTLHQTQTSPTLINTPRHPALEQAMNNGCLDNIPEMVSSTGLPPFRSQRSQSGRLSATEDSDNDFTSQLPAKHFAPHSRQSSFDSTQHTDEYRHFESMKQEKFVNNNFSNDVDPLPEVETMRINAPPTPPTPSRVGEQLFSPRRGSKETSEAVQINAPQLPPTPLRMGQQSSLPRRTSQEIPEAAHMNTPPLPPTPPRVNEQSAAHSNLTVMSYTTQRDDYSYVVTQHFDQLGRPVEVSRCENRNTIKEVKLEKKPYEGFGFHMQGGNKTGIFIESVEQWKPAARADFEIGWKILKINGLSMEKVAFCYCKELLNSLKTSTRVVFTIEVVPLAMYRKVLTKMPFDSFHLETLCDYNPRMSGELGFAKGDTLNVTNSYVVREPSQEYKWFATKSVGNCVISGLIPSQTSARSSSLVAHQDYEHMGLNMSQDIRQGKFYKILDPIDEVLV